MPAFPLQQVATQVVASLLALDSLDPDQEIKMYINCPQVPLGCTEQRWFVGPAAAWAPCQFVASGGSATAGASTSMP